MSTEPPSRYSFHLRLLVKRLGMLLALYSGIRLLFFLRNADSFTGIPDSLEVAEAFLLGIRFDLSAILMIGAPFILLGSLPAPWLSSPWYQRLLKSVFWITNVPFLVLALIDIEFYPFTDRRSTVELFTLATEIREQAGHLILDYWWLTLLGCVIFYGLTRLYPAEPPTSSRPTRVSWKHAPAFLATLALAVLGIRGSLQVRPLTSGHAFAFSTPALGNLALNTPFVFLMSIQEGQGNRKAKRLRYFESLAAAERELPEPYDFGTVAPRNPAQGSGTPDNVLLIVVESLNSELVGFENPASTTSFTPFMDRLASEGRPFIHHFANSKRSITALPAILLSFPDWLSTAFSASLYQSNRYGGLGSALRNRGYSTWFFHGTRPGTMTFDVVSGVAGFENYYTIREYGAHPPEDHDGRWGILDEPMLDRVGQVLGREKGPFAGVLFTLSTHQPQRVPPKYHRRFGERGSGPTVRYFDHSLETFFRKYGDEPWFKKTLFVITGDHTYGIKSPAYATPLGRYDVPLLFYHPGRKLPPADPGKVADQLDITPSILDLLGIHDQPLNRFGHSVFGKTPGEALLRVANVPALANADGVVTLADSKAPVFHRYEGEVGSQLVPQGAEANPAAPALGKRLSAYLQYFHQGLIENAWISPVKKNSK